MDNARLDRSKGFVNYRTDSDVQADLADCFWEIVQEPLQHLWVDWTDPDLEFNQIEQRETGRGIREKSISDLSCCPW